MNREERRRLRNKERVVTTSPGRAQPSLDGKFNLCIAYNGDLQFVMPDQEWNGIAQLAALPGRPTEDYLIGTMCKMFREKGPVEMIGFAAQVLASYFQGDKGNVINLVIVDKNGEEGYAMTNSNDKVSAVWVANQLKVD